MVADRDVRVLIVGAGFSGIGLGRVLLADGIDDFVILDRATAVGGVWQANTYPGCRCDVGSHLYSFSFAPNPDWTETYSAQPEIRAYLERCVDGFGLRSRLRLGVEVDDARWDEETRRWRVGTSDGVWTAQVLVAAVGPLTEPKLPDVPGIDTFRGPVMHSARWDHDVDLAGLRVASIGTGASAIQYVPRIAEEVGELLVFQRTPPWVIPHTGRGIPARARARYRRDPGAQRFARRRVFLAREWLVEGFAKHPSLMRAVSVLARAHLLRQVRDRTLRESLTPSYVMGCKRLLPSNDWYPALQRSNVQLVTSALAEVREHSVVDADGVEHDVDAIVFGTGYHAAEFPFASRLRGRGGARLADVWAGSPRAYAGTSVPGFPNLFLCLGPNTILGHSSMLLMIEAQLSHIRGALRAMDAAAADIVEVEAAAFDAYNVGLDRKLAHSVWETGGCASYYRDVNGRNSTVYPDWIRVFRRDVATVKPDAYRLTA
jgi:cation diffusion facilitator CzcD-associated flavoprotein CzcO